MKKLGLIRLEKFHSTADRQQQGLLPAELDILLAATQPAKAPASDSHRTKKGKRSEGNPKTNSCKGSQGAGDTRRPKRP